MTFAIAPRHFSVVSGVSVSTQARFVRRVHIHARSAMRMHIDKARRKPHAARVDNPRVIVGQVLADLCDQRIFTEHVRPRKLSILINARVFDQELIHPRFSFQRKVRWRYVGALPQPPPET